MRNKQIRYDKALYAVIVAGILFSAPGLRAEERLTVSKTISERTKEYLSDPARTGSLVGSIIAGAAVANPLAPVLGSVAGFLIGKSSDYSKQDGQASQRQAYNNRSLIPQGDVEVSSLGGLTGSAPGEPELAAALEFPTEADADNRSEQAEPIVTVKVPGERGAKDRFSQTERATALGMNEKTAARIAVQKQLAYACSNVRVKQPSSSSCYYYSQ